jgi:hypothetical protein
MTMNVPPRYRLPIAMLASVVVVVVVLVAVLVTSRGGPNTSPMPSTSPSASTDPLSTPEGAVRAFFEAYAQARKTDDPSLVEPFVTSKTSSAYLSAAAFLRGQKESGKASVTTVLRIENLNVEQTGTTATVSFDYTEGGYNIDPTNGSPVESPTVLPTARVTAEVRLVAGRWLVDSYHTL